MEEGDYPKMIERLVPGVNRPWGATSPALNQHLLRYRFAQCYLRPGMQVLDIACGAGYGSWILATSGSRVQGIDASEDAIAYAQTHYPHERIQYLCANADNLPLPEKHLDAAVCLETIEHLPNPAHFLGQIRKLLRDPGLLIVSAPVVPTRHFDPYHLHDFTRDSFIELLASNGFTLFDELAQEQTFLTVVATTGPRAVIDMPDAGDEMHIR